MARLLAIDYGRRRCGIAVTDPLQLVANALTTVSTCELEDFLLSYTASEPVEKIIIGLPTTMRGEPSESMRYITPAINRLRKILPGLPIEQYDERFTSVLAHRVIIDSGVKKMKRRDKAIVDRVSASIILNDYLASRDSHSTF